MEFLELPLDERLNVVSEWLFILLPYIYTFISIGMILVAWKKSSWCTIFEYLLFILVKILMPQVTFTSYFTAKFIQSLIVYVCDFNHPKDQYKRALTYCIGTISHPVHAAVKYNKTAAPDNEQDSLKPEVLELRANATPANWEQPVGFAIDCTKEQIEKFLEVCGRCHQYAVITCYELSYDKFFSWSVLLFLRYDMWILIVGCLVLCPITFILFVDFSGFLIDVLFEIIILIDVANLNAKQLHSNRKSRSSTTRLEALKFILLICIWYSYELYLPNTIMLYPSAQFLLLIGIIFSGSLCMRPTFGCCSKKKRS